MENDGKNTYWKMEENTPLENDRMENAHHGKWQKTHTLENDRKCCTGKCTPWKLHILEFDRLEFAYPGK